MVSIDQVLLLQEKVESAVQKIVELKSENDALRRQCSELTNALSEKTELLNSFTADEKKIETSIIGALNRLNSLEDSISNTVASGTVNSVTKEASVSGASSTLPKTEPSVSEIPASNPVQKTEPEVQPVNTVTNSVNSIEKNSSSEQIEALRAEIQKSTNNIQTTAIPVQSEPASTEDEVIAPEFDGFSEPEIEEDSPNEPEEKFDIF